ncbi:hypothetical protein VAR608DRAFT_3752 [Variovorax sp. HW608]|uniref:hypothetical protein n=1 Tax=Variovorax sp. HW608 TaxID=1034889 RepID=UPI00081FDD20|nr:hypothetical protein [Variovorax sp. HW608]SCK39870.1 hypothetical protein VAR608DRAFT_3752 [Variovorax sp. HW608]
MASEAIFLPAVGSVQFAIYPDGYDGARIIARIDEEALHKRFHAPEGQKDLVQAYALNADSIDALATARYRANPNEAICLHSTDF